MGSCDRVNILIEKSNRTEKSFLGFVKLFPEKRAITLKSTELVAYVVNDTILNMSSRRMKRKIDNGHMLVEFLQVCSTYEQEEEEEVAVDEEKLVCRLTSSMKEPFESLVQTTAD